MNSMLKRSLALLLCLTMLSGMLPVWAEEAPPTLEATAAISDFSENADAEEVSDGESAVGDVLPTEGAAETIAPTASAEISETPVPTAAAEITETNVPTSEPDAAVDSEAVMQAQLSGAIADLAARLEAQNLSSDYEEALWVYSMMLANISTGEGDTAYHAIIECEAGSLGYARAMEALLTAAGLECIVVEGDSSAWIVACLDGEWTHLHPYADDAAGSFGAHFGLTDAAMAQEFSWNRSDIPACTGTSNCFQVRAAGYLAFDSTDALSLLLAQAIEAQAENLKLYNAAALDNAAASVQADLSANHPGVQAEISEDGYFIHIQFSYAAEATPAPTPSITPESAATVSPDEASADPEADTETVASDIELSSLAALLNTQSTESVAASQIVPATQNLVLGVGEKISVADWTLLPEGAQDTVYYSVKSKKIATVNANGLVTAKKAGSTTLTLYTASGLTATIKISVKKAPTKISIKGSSKTMGVGQTQQLSYSLSKSGSAGSVSFTSSNPEIASVTESGLVTALAPGQVTITVATYNGKKSSGTLQILPAPTDVIPAVSEISIGAEDKYKLGYAFNEGSTGSVTFASSDTVIATVDADGTIHALCEGSCTVSITAHNGVIGSCNLTVTPAPTALSLGQTAATLGVGEKLQLSPVLEPEQAIGTVTYKSGNTKVATVNSSGLITAKKAGTATITATTYNGKKATLKVTVKKAPSSISIKGSSKTMGVGQTQQLSYSLSKSGSAGSVSFTSSNPEIASVTESGLVTALAPGKATITVATYNGKKSSGTLQIYPAPSEVIPAVSEISIGAEDKYKLGYAFNEGSTGSVTFASSDTSIATVDADGAIHALCEGSCTVSITAHNGISGSCNLTVAPAPTALSLGQTTATLGVGEKLQLSPVLEPEQVIGTVTYKSGNTKVATVNSSGLITAKKAGTATITATTYNGKKATLKVTVKKAPTKISIKGSSKIMGVGQTQQLSYSLSKSGSAGSVSFTSSNPEIASVTESGLVTALAPGQATITVATYNGKKSSGTLQIYPAPSEVIPAVSEISIGAEDKYKLGYTFNEGSTGSVTFASSDSEIATVDADGAIHALCEGSCTVSITAHNGVIGSCNLTVAPAPTALSLGQTAATLGVGEKLQLSPILQPEQAIGTVTYKSGNTKVATVSAGGLITAKKAGTTTITATTYNGKKVTLKLTVKKAPSSISIKGSSKTMGVGQTHQLSYSLSKSGSAGSVCFTSSNPEIASVTESGLVTALAPGQVTITVATYNGKKSSGTLQIYPAPTDVALAEFSTVMGIGQKISLETTLSPADAHTALAYSVINGDAISVSASGVVTAQKSGTATIRVSTHVDGVYDERTITVLPAPQSISFEETSCTVNIGETLQLAPILTEGSYATVSYKVSKSGYFTIDENGLIVPIQRGSATVTASTYNGLSATVKITVLDPYYPEAMALAEDPPTLLDVGETYTPKLSITPSTAQADIVWSSSTESVCSVDAQTGTITAKDYGAATITGKSTRNPSLSVSFKITVLGNEVCLKMPEDRVYSTSAISGNLTKIKNVRSSAYSELYRLYATGEITYSDYSARHGYIERAFDMYLMPWITDTYEYYWKASNSNNGLKDFKTGTIYFGLPYTQANRRYNKTKAVSAGYYTDTGKGYYKMQGSKFSSRQYPGNDCSSFVSMAIWGTGSSNSYLNTKTIAECSDYRTLSDWTELRPGDILNRSGSHVVMFLYYANREKSQMVVIEQGGGDDETNTISCSIRNVSYYTSRGYSILRVKSLGY